MEGTGASKGREGAGRLVHGITTKMPRQMSGVDILQKRIFYPQTSNLMWIFFPRFFNKKNWYKVIKGHIAG